LVHTSGARSLKAAVADIEDEYCKAYRNMGGLVDMSLNDGPLLKFDIIPMQTATGRVKFTVAKQPDPLPDIEPEHELTPGTAMVTTIPTTMVDAANDPIKLPSGSWTGSATRTTSSTQGAPKRKKRRKGKTLITPETPPPSPGTAGGR
jgi:hypothetical protein